MNVEMPHPARRRLALALASVAAGLPVVTAHAQSVPDEGFDTDPFESPCQPRAPARSK
jgi:hypothetical protein